MNQIHYISQNKTHSSTLLNNSSKCHFENDENLNTTKHKKQTVQCTAFKKLFIKN